MQSSLERLGIIEWDPPCSMEVWANAAEERTGGMGWDGMDINDMDAKDECGEPELPGIHHLHLPNIMGPNCNPTGLGWGFELDGGECLQLAVPYHPFSSMFPSNPHHPWAPVRDGWMDGWWMPGRAVIEYLGTYLCTSSPCFRE